LGPGPSQMNAVRAQVKRVITTSLNHAGPRVGILAILCTVLFNAGLCPVTALLTNHTEQDCGNPPIKERLDALSNSARFSQSPYRGDKKRAASGPEARLWCSNRYSKRSDTSGLDR
jgi:hypothetical protein